MQNISIKNSIKNILSLIFLSLFITHAFALNQCLTKQASTNHETIDTICDESGLSISLRYSSKKRTIWIDSNEKKYFLKINNLKKNANPELVGSQEKIQFITKKILTIENRRFIAITFAERSMQGNGMGQCGAGVEMYFSALEITNSSIIKTNQILIESCKNGIDFAAASPENGEPIQLTKNNKIMFRWLNYPDLEKPATGIYSFSTNSLVVRENTLPYKWVEF